MATKKVYDECCRMLRKHPEYKMTPRECRRVYKPDMRFLFGKKDLVGPEKFRRLSESEKRRHRVEDYVLMMTYL